MSVSSTQPGRPGHFRLQQAVFCHLDSKVTSSTLLIDHQFQRKNNCSVTPTMSSPAKDLPKIADQLKGEILAERSLKPTEAQEKNVLPSADDVKQEKNHQNIMTGTDRQTDRQTDRGT